MEDWLSDWLEPVSDRAFFTKNDPDDPRLGESANKFNGDAAVAGESDVVLLGYADDDGIKLNGGRVGAREAPDAVRRALYKMTPSLSRPKKFRVWDAGNLRTDVELKERHDRARQAVRKFLDTKARVVTIGGGHDYGYSDAAAFCEHVLEQGQKPFIVNFDAHLDVRPDTKGEHSGTPFHRLLRDFGSRIDFFEVGIQDWCNSTVHKKWAEDHGAKVVTLEDWLTSSKSLAEFLSEKVFRFSTREHSLALSVDMDCFASGFAPGASQVFPAGFDANEFLKAWRRTLDQYRPKLAAFYEVSPPLDQDDRSSRLAAILIHQFLFT